MVLQLLAYFYIYSVIGWSLEATYNTVTSGMFINPGMLLGPWCPIYGLGMVGIIKYLRPWWKHLIGLFFGAALMASFVELGTGIILENLFHNRWWDYSDQPWNIQGYLCLSFSLAWGVLAVILVKLVHPFFKRLVEKTPHRVIIWILTLLSLFLLVDIMLTLQAIV